MSLDLGSPPKPSVMHVMDVELRIGCPHRVGVSFLCCKIAASQHLCTSQRKIRVINNLLKDHTSGHKLPN